MTVLTKSSWSIVGGSNSPNAQTKVEEGSSGDAGKILNARERVTKRSGEPLCLPRVHGDVIHLPFDALGFDLDRIDLAAKGLASGHFASFDRRKCKGALNGPSATGKQCPEGWTLYPFPGPQFRDVKDSGSAEASYYTWVDQHNTSGLGENIPISTGNLNDGLIALKDGKITSLANAPKLDEAVIDRSVHIVGMSGIEPYIEALQNGAEVIIAGRSSDTSIYSAMPVMKGFNPATVWHAAKILECGAACVVQRKYPDCQFVTLTDDYFIVEPPNPEYRCDPASVASHNLYENSTPYELVEPSGVLNTFNAKYEAVSDRAVKVSGSTFKESARYTIKLEGAELAAAL